MEGPTGLIYAEVERVARWRFKGIRVEWLFDLVQALEREWLSLVHKRQAAAAKKPPEPEKPKGKR